MASMTLSPVVVALVLSLATAAFFSHVVSNFSVEPVPVHLPPHPTPEGVFSHNSLLHSLTKLGDGKLLQPEDMVADQTKTFLYTSNHDGWIKKYYLSNGTVEDWIHVGGRPLGIALGSDGEVLVCEPEQGLLIKIDEEGSKEVLASEAEGIKFGLIDAVTVSRDGLVYFTDASTKHHLSVWWYDTLEGKPTGRIAVYNPKDKSTKVLLKDVYFPNGITLSKSEEYLIFCETTMARCTKYFLEGKKNGSTETFIDNLPGHPDNIHHNLKYDRFYIGILGNRNKLTDFASKTPVVKQLLAFSNILYLLYDNTPKMGRFLAVDDMGKPFQMYEDPTGKVIGFLTSAVEVDGYLYAGGLRDSFVGRIKLQ